MYNISRIYGCATAKKNVIEENKLNFVDSVGLHTSRNIWMTRVHVSKYDNK